jgi:hypothetical protein
MSRNIGIEDEVRRIDSKRALLAYLRSPPKKFTVENYLCLAGILARGGWRFDGSLWHKGSHSLPTMAAGIVELELQVASDKERVLRRTVTNYRGGNPGRQPCSPEALAEHSGRNG